MAYMNASGTIITSWTGHLAHHGIRGQKWGIRRYQNKDGTLTPLGRKRAQSMGEDYTIKSGSKLYRVSSNQNSYNDSSNRVYVSGNKRDHIKWQNFYDANASYLTRLYDARLETVKDIKVAGETALGEAWLASIASKEFRKQALSDLNMAAEKYGLDSSAKDESDMTYDKFARTLGYHTKSGDGFMRFMNQVAGYDAITDVYGKHTKDSKSLRGITEPLIVLNPQDNLRRQSVKKMYRAYGA